MPPPGVLEGYRNLIPDAPERILRMAEEDAAHQREMERLQLAAIAAEGRRGQVLGTLLGSGGLGGGIYAIALGYATAGAAIITGGVAAAAAVFIQGRHTQSHREE